MRSKFWLHYGVVALIFFAFGAAAYRWYIFIPTTHPLKMAIHRLHSDGNAIAGERELSFLQSIHVATAHDLSFIDPDDSAWLIKSNHYDWKRADNLNFLYILSAIQNDRRMQIRVSADNQPRLRLDDFRAFNSVYRNVHVNIHFPNGVPQLSTLDTFQRTNFNPKLKPRVNGHNLIVDLPTFPFFIDYLAPKDAPESQSQRGQIAHLYIMLALELYATHHNIRLVDFLADKNVVASDDNSYSNHQLINATARYIQDRIGGVDANARGLRNEGRS